jgi:hypothetical protein
MLESLRKPVSGSLFDMIRLRLMKDGVVVGSQRMALGELGFALTDFG